MGQKLSSAEYSAYLDVAQSQRKALKQLPKHERHAYEHAARLRTEMQMLELELRGTDLEAVKEAVRQFEAAAARAEQSADAGQAPLHSSRAATSLVRQLLRMVQVERSRCARLEGLLQEQAVSQGILPPVAGSYLHDGSAGGVITLPHWTRRR